MRLFLAQAVSRVNRLDEKTSVRYESLMANKTKTPLMLKPRARMKMMIFQSGESQNAFARSLGVSHGTISRILAGKDPDLRTAVLLERKHGIACKEWIP